jgi:hypothetical protein
MSASSQPKTVAEFFKSKIAMVEDDQDQHTRRVRSWVKNWMFYRGNHYGDFDRNGNWVQLPDSQTEDLRYTDDFMFYVEAKATQWTQSAPELSISAAASNNSQYVQAARHIERELTNYRLKVWTPEFQQSLSKFAMLSTCYFIYTRPKRGNEFMSVPSFGEKQVQGKGVGFCASCGWSGPETNACPDCGSPVAIKPGATGKIQAPTGLEKIPVVDIGVDLVDPMEIRLDPKCRAAKISTADFMRRERYIRDYEAEMLYEDFAKKVDPHAVPTDNSDVLNYKQALEQNVSGLSVDTKGAAARCNKLRREYWFDLKVYRNFSPERDEEFAGHKFKAHEKLGDVFPEGVYLDQIDGKHFKIDNEDKNKVWTGSVDTIDPTSPYGRGFSGLVNLQEMMDEGVSLGFAFMMRDALGLQVYDPQMLEASDVESTRVGGALPLKPGAQIEGRPITAALINVEHKQLSSFTLPFLQMVDSKMPHAAGGAYDVLGGGAGTGAGAKTLGGQQQQLQTAAGMVGPALQLRAQAEVDAFIQYLEHLQEFGTPEHFKSVAGDWGEADARAFKNCNIRKHIAIVPIQNSEIPRTQEERKTDVAIAINSGLANPEAPIIPGVRKYGLEQLRIPLEDDPTEQMRRAGNALLEKMRQAAKYISSIPGDANDIEGMGEAVAAVAPLVKARDEGATATYREIFQGFLRSTTEDEKPDAVLNLAVQLKLEELEEFEVEMSTEMNAKATITQAPMAIAQMQMQKAMEPESEDAGAAAQAQADAQTQQKQAETQMEMQKEEFSSELETRQKSLDHAENESQRRHEASESQKERTHNLATAKIQAKQKAQDAKKKASTPAKR